MNNDEGRFHEKIESGAMRRSFRESLFKIQFDHEGHPMEPVRDAIVAQTIYGMSFRNE